MIERAQLAEALIPRKAVDEFTLGINAAMVALLSAHGATSQNSLLLKRLKAYAGARRCCQQANPTTCVVGPS